MVHSFWFRQSPTDQESHLHYLPDPHCSFHSTYPISSYLPSHMTHTIVIRHLTGTQKGKDQVITSQEVSLGTGPGNTVRLDAVWDKGVSPTHARIFRDAASQWQLEDAGSSTGTFVNGQRVTQRRQVGGSLVIELGHGGPKIEVVLPPALPASAAHGSQSSSGGAGKLVLITASVIGLGIAAWFLINRSGAGDSDERLQQVAKTYEEGISLVVIATEGKSIPMGTAWAVAPGMFATNAHVAAPVYKAMKQGASAYVAVNKRPDQRFRVKLAVPHPRYFSNEVGMTGKAPVTPPYDVGILLIEGTASATLRAAATPKLQALDSGHRIAFLGFPMEDLQNGGVDPNNPVATMQSGIVTASTDFWLAKSAFENRRLIQHNLPTVGGSSGSPIFDSDGDVVGILSSGNMIAAMTIDQWVSYKQQIEQAKQKALEKAKKAAESQPKEKHEAVVADLNATLEALDNIPIAVTELKRAPSAAMVNYAQRIDMLEELIAMVKAAQAE